MPFAEGHSRTDQTPRGPPISLSTPQQGPDSQYVPLVRLPPWSAPTAPVYSPYWPFQSCFTPHMIHTPLSPLYSTPLPPATYTPRVVTPPHPFQQPFIPPPNTPYTPAMGTPRQRVHPYNTPYLPPNRTPIWPTEALYADGTPAPDPQTASFTPQWEPGTFPAEPLGEPVPFRVHPQLIWNPTNPDVPALQWDIIHRAEQARTYTGRHTLVPPNLTASAVEPSATKLYIASDHYSVSYWMEKWGPIMVEKSDITVRDVLDAIYDYFQKPLSPDDLQKIRESAESYNNLNRAARQRTQDEYQLSTLSEQYGYKRVDVAGGHRRFQGLRPVVFQNQTWKLYLGLLPGPVPRVH
ncbi:hypothetical protein BD779DRAFT_1618347 [Infundibulicybe gibba]|nr:hypothetical protein BD779DRAFT_1618347 [Infundibulicybe gibba]